MKRVLMICSSGATIGLGHLRRMQALQQVMLRKDDYTPEILCFVDRGSKLPRDQADPSVGYCVDLQEIFNAMDAKKYDVIILDNIDFIISKELKNFINKIKEKTKIIVGIECLEKYIELLDFLWIPSFYNSLNIEDSYAHKLYFGWNKYLLQKSLETTKWQIGNDILVITGGSDPSKLSINLPRALEQNVNEKKRINWVRGPFADAPLIPKVKKHTWIVHDSPIGLDELIVRCNYAICVFGVSFFEVLQYRRPCVFFPLVSDEGNVELNKLANKKVGLYAYDYEDATSKLNLLIKDHRLAETVTFSTHQLEDTGCELFCTTLEKYLRNS